jgi:peroxiredoxin Q/BCP
MTRLTAGELAPDFEATTWDGKSISLGGFRGAKLWLAFYRFATCPMCNYRIHELSARFDDFERAGIRLVAVMQSPAERIAQFAEKRKPKFPVIADPGLAIYNKYGVGPSLMAMMSPSVFVTAFKAMFAGIFPGRIDGPIAMVPADFLIDPEGVIWDAFYARKVSEHVPFGRVSEFAADDCLRVPAA